ncbi:MAG: TIR domain-containing protein, partial [Ignavibacteriales bacterium]|nr:TIR domain-containing protein [Ignavibacteriales bacterium]
MSNPFSFTNSLPNSFCNREKEINDLLKYTSESINVLLFSRRREGKTALIFQLFEIIKARKKNLNTIYIDLLPTESIEDFITRLLSSYTQIETNFEKFKKFLSSFNPTISFDAISGSPTVSLDFKKTITSEQIEEVFSLFEYRSKKVKTLIVFDEFYQIINYPNGRKLLNKLCSILNTHKFCSYIFIVNKSKEIHEILSDLNSPFRNLVVNYELQPISIEHYSKWINQLANNTIEKNYIEFLLQKTQSNPYYIQRFLFYSWDRKLFTKNSIFDIEEQLLSQSSYVYQDYWSMLTKIDQAILKFISITDNTYYSIKEISLGTSIRPSSVARALNKLMNWDILYDDSKWVFNDPLFRNWILREFVMKRNVSLQNEISWDVFISHASEDKEKVARPLALALEKKGLKVWYDEFSLKIGDSLNRKITEGLAKSRFGVVIISPSFLSKEWPQKELDGLVS